MLRINAAVLSLAIALNFATASALAETRVETKLMQFGGPETRTRCINNLKTKGVPSCTVKNWTLKCEDTWIITCTEWATDFMQHEIFLIAAGPDADKAVENVLRSALEKALVAAVAAAAATPGEVAVKSAAAIAAFKATLYAALAAEPALAALKDQYNLSIEDRTHW